MMKILTQKMREHKDKETFKPAFRRFLGHARCGLGRRSGPRLLLVRLRVVSVGGEPAKDKLLKDGANRSSSNPDRGISKRKPHPVAA
jgi:hypothetical protein